ncbi:hypothetical protein HYALB_00007549 [Hymenoscyphus albidus]|uniref:ATP-dependent RNA helicase n=1 Tax=Hymenoscyphus albidus TaxID=595503 RepID=A0A9N9Q618_9HELO|nr:hypothetical protein HYALB_00007549 [Hymenoscyphus albidus]
MEQSQRRTPFSHIRAQSADIVQSNMSTSMLFSMLPSALQARIPRLSSLRRSVSSIALSQSLVSPTPTTGFHTPDMGYTTAMVLGRSNDLGGEYGSSIDSDDEGLQMTTVAASSSEEIQLHENSTGISWKYANQGLNLLGHAVSESSACHQTGGIGNASFARQMYIHSLTYLLRALPHDMTTEEQLSVRSSLPEGVVEPLGFAVEGGMPNTATGSLKLPQRKPSLLHRTLATTIVQLVIFFQLIFPHIKNFLQSAYRYDRQHKITEKVLTQGVTTVDEIGKRGLTVTGAIYGMGNGRVGELITESATWLVEGVSGGIHEGLGEGMAMMGGMRTPARLRDHAGVCCRRLEIMFNAACRRGPASIPRVLRTATTTSAFRISSARPSPLQWTSSTSTSKSIAARPLVETRWLHVSSMLRSQAAGAREHAPQEKQTYEITKFNELLQHDLVHPNIVNRITRGMGHHTMTSVQSMTINQALQGADIIAQARTGTGKTLGFLVPTLQNILARNPDLAVRKRYSRARASDIRAIIISPTRELAEQIAVEAQKLCQDTDLIVQVAVGGNSKRDMLMKTRREGCHILVGTPGRLYDLLSDPRSGVEANDLTTLVMDEADRLLDDGFSVAIDEIQKLLPDREQVDRQTLLFSATVPREVMHLVKRTLKRGFHFVQTVKEGELATHEKVPQFLVAMPGYENFMPGLFEFCKREVEKAAKGEAMPFKAIIYFQSTANVQLSYRIFDNLIDQSGGRFGKSPLHPAEFSQIHGQLSQGQRQHTSDRFRRAKSAILFSTDVTARGLDFPNVSHVIQIGLPSNRDQYVHRVGRTGRGDKAGVGYLFIHESEIRMADNMLRGLPLKEDLSLEMAKVDMTEDAQLPASVADIISKISDATKMVDRETKYAAYMGALGQMKGISRGIEVLNQWTKFGWGWAEPPSVSPALAARLEEEETEEEETKADLVAEDDPLDLEEMVEIGNRSERENDFKRPPRPNDISTPKELGWAKEGMEGRDGIMGVH